MTRMVMRTTDEDVVVPAVANGQMSPATDSWGAFCVGKNFTYIPAN